MPKRSGLKHVGVMGFPIAHTLSPAFQQPAFDFYGIPARYAAWEVTPAELAEEVARLREPKYLGVNVTIPHKEAVIPLLDEVDPLAARIGAVNTIVNQDGRLFGFNTDAAGFLRALEKEAAYSPQGKHALILGAGGAARAVAYALVSAGVSSVVVANRHFPRAQSLVDDLRSRADFPASEAIGMSPADLAEAADEADMVVNATSIGMRHTDTERELPLPANLLRRGQLVCDLVYNPPRTSLLAAASSIGAATLEGLPMLVYQGAVSFEMWTARDAPIGLMFEWARRALANRG